MFREVYERPADPIELALAWNADDPLVAATVARVTKARLGLLERIFTELGLSADEAADRAWLAYAFYAGHHQLGRIADLRDRQPVALDRLARLLIAPATEPSA